MILDFDPFNPEPLLHILQRCPLAGTVVRPCILESGGSGLGRVRLPAGTEFPTFPGVKRIDWWLPGVIPELLSYTARNPGPPPGFLGELVAHSPNLKYLTLSGGTDWRTALGTWIPIEPFINPTYHSLTTLRFESEAQNVMSINTTSSLPQLKRLILGVLYVSVQPILKTHGHLIRILELIDVVLPPHAQAVMAPSNYCTRDVLAACPNLEEFCAPLSMGTRLMTENTTRVIWKSLSCIRLKLDDSSPITSPDIGFFIRDKLSCPALERIVLHGKPEAWKENACYKLLEAVVARTKFGVLEFS